MTCSFTCIEDQNQPEDDGSDEVETFDTLYVFASEGIIKQSSLRHDYSLIKIPSETSNVFEDEQKIYNEIYFLQECNENDSSSRHD